MSLSTLKMNAHLSSASTASPCLKLGNFSAFISFAIDNAFSNVLEDLESDENFVVEEYPVNMTDYSLQIINVAESTDKELFIYVYQPCSPNDRLKATSIRTARPKEPDLL